MPYVKCRKGFSTFFSSIFLPKQGQKRVKGGIKVRTLTLDDRRKIEMMWGENTSPVKIAEHIEINTTETAEAG